MLVRKRSVPALSSKASPDCVEAPLNIPQDRGTDATHPGVQICGLGGFGIDPYILKETRPRITVTTIRIT